MRWRGCEAPREAAARVTSLGAPIPMNAYCYIQLYVNGSATHNGLWANSLPGAQFRRPIGVDPERPRRNQLIKEPE